MNLNIILKYSSYFVTFIPLIATIAYWHKKKFSFDFRVNLIGIYIVFYSIIQNSMLIFALNGINNLFIIRIFAPIETLICSYFILLFQVRSKRVVLILAILFSAIIIGVDLIWGNSESGPVESLMVEAILITLIGMAAIPAIRIKKDYESSFFYFVFGILFSSVNTLIGVGFIDLAPDLSFSIQSVVNITSHLIITWGFYIILKSKPEIGKNNVKEPTPN